VPGTASFEELLDEGAGAPVEGWDFSWFAGRASEERPPWRFAELLSGRLAAASSALDLETGGGEVLAWALGRAGRRPPRCAATESWPPNLELAHARLGAFGVAVLVAGGDALPVADSSFELVTSRHPVATHWGEIARVLRPGGAYLSQQIGAGSNRELYELFLGPQPPSPRRTAARARAEAAAAGLVVSDLREATLRVEFRDVAAVVAFLRKVIWTVPGFSVQTHRDRLAELHGMILRDGSFVCHSRRLLVEAHRPR
jgi:SAM-dependent methyltransferase